MFGSNDIVSDIDKSKILNIYVHPYLLLNDIETDQKNAHILFTYHFSEDNFIFEGVFDLTGIKAKFGKEYVSSYNYCISTLKFTQVNKNNKRSICIFQYAPQGSFSPSWYSFDISSLKKLTDNYDYTFGVSSEYTKYNSWFSNASLKERVNWENLQHKHDVFNDVPENPLIVWFVNENRDNDDYSGVRYCKIDDYLKRCKKQLVPLDMQNLIIQTQKRATHKRLFIFNVRNYLTNYFLLSLVDTTGTNCTFEFINSPNDTSII